MGELLDACVGQAAASRKVEMFEASWWHERLVIDVVPRRFNPLDQHSQRVVCERLAIGQHQSFESIPSM